MSSINALLGLGLLQEHGQTADTVFIVRNGPQAIPAIEKRIALLILTINRAGETSTSLLIRKEDASPFILHGAKHTRKCYLELRPNRKPNAGRGNQLEHVRSLGYRITTISTRPAELYASKGRNHYETKSHYGKSGDVLQILSPPIVLLLWIYSLSFWRVLNGLVAIAIAFRDILGRRPSGKGNILFRVIGDGCILIVLARHIPSKLSKVCRPPWHDC